MINDSSLSPPGDNPSLAVGIATLNAPVKYR